MPSNGQAFHRRYLSALAIETRSAPALTHVLPPIRPLGFPIHVARRPPAPFARCYPRSFTFHFGNPRARLRSIAPTCPPLRLKLARLPLSLAASLAALPSISETSFLNSSVPGFLIENSLVF